MIKKRGVTRTQPVVCKPVAAFCAFTPTLRSMFNVMSLRSMTFVTTRPNKQA